MPRSQCYPVTIQLCQPQPHLTDAVKSSDNMSLSGWIPFAAAGVLALCFLVFVYTLGSSRIFLEIVDPRSDLVPIVKKGSLEVYPLLPGISNGVRTRYWAQLPPKNLHEMENTLDTLLKNYPRQHGRDYRNCWLENPIAEKPCFFDSSWVTQVCSKNNSYGYDESEGLYNLCFILKLEKTEDWVPLVQPLKDIPASVTEHRDPGFVPVDCSAKDLRGPNRVPNITVFPAKGFSLLYFPASKFNSEKYLSPLVAVKINDIGKQTSVTIECSVITPNAFLLWNDGKVAINLTSS